MEQRYIITTAISTIAVLTGIAAGHIYESPLITGIGIAVSILCFRYAEKFSNLHGKTREVKILNTLTSNFIELSAAASTILFIQEPVATVILTSLTGFSLAFKSEVSRKLSVKTPKLLKRNERVLMVSAVFVSGVFNEYLFLYGVLALIGMFAVDLLRTVYVLVSG